MIFRTPVTRPLHEFGWPRPSGSDEFRVTSPYGLRPDPLGSGGTVFHGGLDIGNGRLGYPVVAVAPGTVIVATRNPVIPWNYPAPVSRLTTWGVSYGGNTVVIDHGSGVFSQYAHLGRIDVARDAVVASGHQLGIVGDTGSAYHQGHLHFGIRWAAAFANDHNGFIDPWPLITGQQTLPDTSIGDDMQLPPGLVPFTHAVLGANNNLRESPSLDAPARLVTAALYVAVYGQAPGGAWTVAGTSGSEWYLVGVFGKFWWVATALLPTVTLTSEGADVLSLPAPDCTQQVADATLALTNKLNRARTAVGAAAQAVQAAQGALT